MTELRARVTTGRGMGEYVPLGEPPSQLEEKPAGRPLTTLVREERCAECPWPETCATDRTCWEEESQVAEHKRSLAKLGIVIDVEAGVEVAFRHAIPEHAQKLLERLGAAYVVDADAPACVGPCGQPECRGETEEPKEETMQEEGRQALDDMDTGVTVPCKIDGCDHKTTVTRGRYAHLCVEHRAEAAGGGGSAPAERASASTGSGWASRVRDLVPLARKLDRAEAKLAAAPQTTSAKAELEEAIRRVQGAPTPENLDRLAAATKAMQKGKDPRKKAEKEHEEAARSFKQELAALTRRAAGS